LPNVVKPPRTGTGARPPAYGYTPLKAHSNRVTSAAYVNARVDGRFRRCLLDSGADVSLIPKAYVNRPDLIDSGERLRAANGTEIHITGRQAIPVVVNRKHTNANFLVSPNIDEVILGRDWLVQNAVQWDFAKGLININGKPVHLNGADRNPPRCRRCRVSVDSEIPPETEVVLPTDIIYGHFAASDADVQWTTVPSEPVPGLRVARTLIATDAASTAVRVCNLTKSPIHLRRGQSVSVLQNVEAIDVNQAPFSDQNAVRIQHADMLSRVDNSVKPETKAELKTLLETYQDVFSYSEYDLGHTNITQHDINTGENKAVKQPLRPQPRAHLPVIDKLLGEMQSQGIIEPCQSEWGSNIVLVKKKMAAYDFA